VRTVVEDTLNQRITIREGDRTRSVTKLDGVILTMVSGALKGDAKAQASLITVMRSIGIMGEAPEIVDLQPFTPNDDAVLADFLRRHIVSPGALFAHNWHIEAISFALTRVLAGEIKRLIITVPPRSLKSICASVAFPAFILGHDPQRKIICVSYSEGLARKHANDCRAVMRSNLYNRLFPNSRISNRTAPTIRGKWVLEQLLGTPPPPPNVPALKDG
jgi:hypothetical protein